MTVGGSMVGLRSTQVGPADLRSVQARSSKKKGRVAVRHCSLHAGRGVGVGGGAWGGGFRVAPTWQG